MLDPVVDVVVLADVGFAGTGEGLEPKAFELMLDTQTKVKISRRISDPICEAFPEYSNTSQYKNILCSISIKSYENPFKKFVKTKTRHRENQRKSVYASQLQHKNIRVKFVNARVKLLIFSVSLAGMLAMAFMGCRQTRSQLEETIPVDISSASPVPLPVEAAIEASSSPMPIVSPSPMIIDAPRGCPAVDLVCPPTISPMYCWAEDEQGEEMIIGPVRGNQCAAVNELARMACNHRVDLAQHRIRCVNP